MEAKSCLLLLIFFSVSNVMYGQESVINDSKQKETIILNVKLLTGIWESTDTLKSKIEFVDSKYYFFLQQEGEGHYTFMKDSLDRVSSSGFIAAWPPFNCDLKVISKDTLEVIYSHYGGDESIQNYVRVK